MISLAGCLDNNTEPKPVVDYGGFSEYYIVNQSELDLNATYKIAPTPIDKDSTIVVPADSTTKIFEYGGIGGNFQPSYVFANLSFYKLSDKKMISPLLTIEPIVDKNWKSVNVKGDNTIKYELIITNGDIK
jgi:hypothetical protein